MLDMKNSCEKSPAKDSPGSRLHRRVPLPGRRSRDTLRAVFSACANRRCASRSFPSSRCAFAKCSSMRANCGEGRRRRWCALRGDQPMHRSGKQAMP